jgi:hypothetical protein
MRAAGGRGCAHWPRRRIDGVAGAPTLTLTDAVAALAHFCAPPDSRLRQEGRIVGYDGIATLPVASTRRIVICIMSEPGFPASTTKEAVAQTFWGQSYNLNAWMGECVWRACVRVVVWRGLT